MKEAFSKAAHQASGAAVLVFVGSMVLSTISLGLKAAAAQESK